jgi:N-alpha-acetyltransferase 50
MDIQLGNLTPANIEQLKLINTVTLPVRYSEKFYKDLLTTYNSDYIKIAFCNGFSVGAICARIEEHPDHEGKKRLYIMTVNVLAAYRKHGIGMFIINNFL